MMIQNIKKEKEGTLASTEIKVKNFLNSRPPSQKLSKIQITHNNKILSKIIKLLGLNGSIMEN